MRSPAARSGEILRLVWGRYPYYAAIHVAGEPSWCRTFRVRVRCTLAGIGWWPVGFALSSHATKSFMCPGLQKAAAY